MYITQNAKQLAEYETLAHKVLSGLPPQITFKVMQTDEYTLGFKIYFGQYPTNFWITDNGRVVYIEKDFGIYMAVKKEALLKEFNGFLKDCLENPD